MTVAFCAPHRQVAPAGLPQVFGRRIRVNSECRVFVLRAVAPLNVRNVKQNGIIYVVTFVSNFID